MTNLLTGWQGKKLKVEILPMAATRTQITKGERINRIVYSNAAVQVPDPKRVAEDRMRTAVHEAGHAVAEQILRGGVTYVTIQHESEDDNPSRRLSAGSFISCGFTEPKRRITFDEPSTLSDLESQLICDLAGGWAEASVRDGEFPLEEAANDIANAQTHITFHFVPQAERKAIVDAQERTASGETVTLQLPNYVPLDERQRIAGDAARKALEFVESHKRHILLVANNLLRKKRLSGKEVAALVNSLDAAA